MSWRFGLLWVCMMGCASLVVAGQLLPSGQNPSGKAPDLPPSPQAAQSGTPKKDEKPRKLGLESYHAKAVEIFAQTPGFGLDRMPPLMRKVQEDVVTLSPGELDVDSPLVREPKLIDANKMFAAYFGAKQPSRFEPRLSGRVFLPATINQPAATPDQGKDKTGPVPTKQWRIETLNLVGLTDPTKPVVYSSHHFLQESVKKQIADRTKTSPDADNPPKVNGDANSPPSLVRQPNIFEEVAIQKLLKGQPLFAHGQDDTIRMMGALRATKDCTSCHSVKEGDLLGALSYTLKKAN